MWVWEIRLPGTKWSTQPCVPLRHAPHFSFFWVIVRRHNWGVCSQGRICCQSEGDWEHGLQSERQIIWQDFWGDWRPLFRGEPASSVIATENGKTPLLYPQSHCWWSWPPGLSHPGPISPLVHEQCPWEYNFIWKSLRRGGKAVPLHLSYPQCKWHLQGGRRTLSTNKNILTISEDQSAEACNELAGIGSKRLTNYLSKIRKGGSCFEWEVGSGG